MKGEIAVRYTIRHFDLPLLTFEANMDSADTDLHIIKVYEENRSFLASTTRQPMAVRYSLLIRVRSFSNML